MKATTVQSAFLMQLLFSGAIRSRPRQGEESSGDTSIEAVTWDCRVCGKKNRTEADGGDTETERCKCCSRDRDPLWLFLEQHYLQLQIGTQIQLPDDPAFGTRVGVVSGIDFFKQCIQLLALSSRITSQTTTSSHGQRETKSASGRRGKLRFETLEYDITQLQQLIPVSTESTDQVQELIAALQQHGICGDCRRVFRIAQGDVAQKNANQEAIHLLQEELRRCGDQKQQHIKLRYYDRVLENTSALKTLEGQLSEQKRTLEFLGTPFCPHCGWIARPDESATR